MNSVIFMHFIIWMLSFLKDLIIALILCFMSLEDIRIEMFLVI